MFRACSALSLTSSWAIETDGSPMSTSATIFRLQPRHESWEATRSRCIVTCSSRRSRSDLYIPRGLERLDLYQESFCGLVSNSCSGLPIQSLGRVNGRFGCTQQG